MCRQFSRPITSISLSPMSEMRTITILTTYGLRDDWGGLRRLSLNSTKKCWIVPAALEGSWPDVGLLPCCWLQLKEVVSSSGVTPPRFACTGTSDEQTCPGSERRPYAHGVNPRVPLSLASHLEPFRHEWIYRIAPMIIETHKPYHDENVGTQLAGRATVGAYCLIFR